MPCRGQNAISPVTRLPLFLKNDRRRKKVRREIPFRSSTPGERGLLAHNRRIAITTKTTLNRPDQMARDQKLIEGLTKHAGVITTLYVDGQPFTAAQAVTTLQARVNTGNAVVPAKAVYREAVKADRDERAQTKAFVSGLRQALLLMFAGQPQVLADLGIEPRKAPASRTSAQKQAAVKRALTTRELRHTMGPKKRAAIQAPPVPVEPATAQVTPEPAAPTPPAVAPANKPQS
jgi:hypothetical protein